MSFREVKTYTIVVEAVAHEDRHAVAARAMRDALLLIIPFNDIDTYEWPRRQAIAALVNSFGYNLQGLVK